MIRTEVLEIKKQFRFENCSISMISGCYVDGEKNIKAKFTERFLCLPEEEQFKYLEIFKKTLSGNIGKNLININIPVGKIGGAMDMFLNVLDSGLKDEDILEDFFQRIIDTYEHTGNYLILVIYSAYDVPGKTKDKQAMEDASEEVYRHILCSICPVNLSKPGLSYNSDTNQIQKRIQDWVVSAPDNGFLFPAFNDRSPDEDYLLYYAKNPEDDQSNFMKQFMECKKPPTAGDQKEMFQMLIVQTMGENCTYEVISNIHERLNDMQEEHQLREIPEPLMIDRVVIRNILEDSGVEEEQLQEYDSIFERIAGDSTSLQLDNIINRKLFEVTVKGILIRSDPDKAELIKQMDIDGKKCIVIEMDHQIEVNGILVKAE